MMLWVSGGPCEFTPYANELASVISKGICIPADALEDFDGKAWK
jgi:hypothetical protein